MKYYFKIIHKTCIFTSLKNFHNAKYKGSQVNQKALCCAVCLRTG